MKRTTLLVSTVVLVGLLVLIGATSLNAQSGNQWQVDYYPNTNWEGNPVYTQFVPYLNFNWGTGSPGPNMPTDNWTARATTDAYFYSGIYHFTALADDELVLTIDNVVYLDTRGKGQSGKTQTLDIPMNQGTHNVRVDYREYTGNAYLSVTWTYNKPGTGTPVATPTPGPPLPVPAAPQSATSVTTEYGDYTPCIQNGTHQSNCFVSDGAWNSPNMGSIQMEPQITIWGNCEPPDSDVTWTVDANSDPIKLQDFRCSKTLAGWFPSGSSYDYQQ